jgi:hypothetical protein
MTTEEQRNDGLHPRHPGRGCSTALVELEGVDRPEVGGFMVFLPSGDTKVVTWTSTTQITPTLEAAKDYSAALVKQIDKRGDMTHPDIQKTNWTSVLAAVQRVIIDFNSKLSKAITEKIVRDMAPKRDLLMPDGSKRRLH